MSQIFKFPVNYRYGRRAFTVDSSNVRISASALIDNDYRTFSDGSRFVFETHGDSSTDASRVTHVFIKGSGITNYSVSVPSGQGSGTGLSAQTIPAGGVVNGIQNDLRAVGPLSATEVEVSVTGVSARVYEVMLLEEVIEVENLFTAVNPTRIDTSSQIRQNIRGETIRVAGLAGRHKWQTQMEMLFLPSTTPTADEFLRAIEENANFTFAEDFARWPDRVYLAYQASDISIAYVGRMFNQRRVSLAIAES